MEHWDLKERPAVTEAWKALLAAGLNWIDTAQAYGTDGESERICGELFEGMRREDFVTQTKWFVVLNVTNVLAGKNAEGVVGEDEVELYGYVCCAWAYSC